jgi:hypothetical protein
MVSVEAALAGIKPWPIEVDALDRTWTIPARPASEWFLAVLSGRGYPIVPELLADGQEELFSEAMINGEIQHAELERLNREALEVASGMPWYQAERLMVSVAAQWRTVGGLFGLHGVDLDTTSLGRVLSTTYVLAIQHLTKEERFSFDARLTAPPPGQRASDYNPADYQEAFAELIRQSKVN